MLRKADRARAGDKLLRDNTQMRVEIRIRSGSISRRMAAGGRLRIIRHTVDRILRSIGRFIRACGLAMAIRARRLRDIWATG